MNEKEGGKLYTKTNKKQEQMNYNQLTTKNKIKSELGLVTHKMTQ